jgi:hypothetical protein
VGHREVGFAFKNGQRQTGSVGPFRANFGLMHRSKRYFHSEHLVGALKQKPV